MLPEIKIRNFFIRKNIEMYTTLPSVFPDEFILLQRTGGDRVTQDSGNGLFSKQYGFILQCFAPDAFFAGTLAEKVADLMEGDFVYSSSYVESVDVISMSTMPPFEGREVYTVGIEMMISGNNAQ